MADTGASKAGAAARAMILPLALAQFIASYAATNMNVAISAIAKDLGTDVAGVQTAITLFTLTMAALMIPGSKLTDIWGRKRCFVLGLGVYAVGGLLAALSMGLPLLIIGYSLLEGVGSALMIPPIYILITVACPDITSRAKYFGVVSGAGGLGAASGPLIGGLVTSAISWRASFGLQVLVVAWIILLARKITEPARQPGPTPRFDLTGAVLSAAGLFFVVLGFLQSRTYGFGKSRQDFTIGNTVVIPKGSISPVWLFEAIGALFLLWFFLYTRSRENKGKDVLLPLRLFRNKISNLGLGTQTIQWLILQGSFFAVSVYLQEVNHYNAIQTGLMLTPATAGILAASAGGRLARRHPQRWLIIVGFAITAVGMILLLALVRANAGIWRWIPGLLLFGAGVGVMLTASVNVVQSSFPDKDQGDISGLSRSVSNLGSSLGTALVGSVLVAVKLPSGKPFAVALTVMLVLTLLGLVLAVLIPRKPIEATAPASPGTETATPQPTP